MRTTLGILMLVGLAAGCKNEEPREGQFAGECTDGADNDVDGLFDCDDNDCWSAPDCAGGPTGGDDPTGDTEPPAETDFEEPDVDPTAVAGHLKSFSLSMSIDFTPDSLFQSLCDAFFPPEPGRACVCRGEWRGKGSLNSATGAANMYDGEWVSMGDTCSRAPQGAGQLSGLSLADASVWVPEDETAFHTIRFQSDLSKLKEWVAHDFEDDNDTTMMPFENSQWWVKTTSNHTYDAGDMFVDYREFGAVPIDLIIMNIDVRTLIQFSDSLVPPPYPVLPGSGDTDTDTDP